MTNVVCIVYDKVAVMYSAPMTFTNVDTARRWFNNKVIENKEDYILYQIGEYDDTTGKLTAFKDEVKLV